MKRLVIIGASGHGKVVADIAKKNGYEKVIFLDDNSGVKECAGFLVMDNSGAIEKYKEWEFFVAIGNKDIRQKLQKKIKKLNYNLATLIHPCAVVSRRVSIGGGTVVMAGAVINSDTVVGEGCIINTSSSVDHDCTVEDYVHVSVGAHVAGNVHLGKGGWIGAGAIVSNNLTICDECIVGAGAVVVSNIREKGTYVGVPAKRICR